MVSRIRKGPDYALRLMSDFHRSTLASTILKVSILLPHLT